MLLRTARKESEDPEERRRLEQRERDRGKTGYTRFSVRALCADFLRETPAIGLALDNSAETPQQTAARILANRWA